MLLDHNPTQNSFPLNAQRKVLTIQRTHQGKFLPSSIHITCPITKVPHARQIVPHKLIGRMSGSRTVCILPERRQTGALDSRMFMFGHNPDQGPEIWRETAKQFNNVREPHAGNDVGVLPPPPIEWNRVSEKKNAHESAKESRGPRSTDPTGAMRPHIDPDHSLTSNNDSFGSTMDQSFSLLSRSLPLPISTGPSTPASKKMNQCSSNTALGMAEAHAHAYLPTPNGLKPRQSVHLLRSKVHCTLATGCSSSPVASITSSMDGRNQSMFNAIGDTMNKNKSKKAEGRKKGKHTKGSKRKNHRSRPRQPSDLIECNSNLPSSHEHINSVQHESYSRSSSPYLQSTSSGIYQNQNSSCRSQQQLYPSRKPFMDILPNRKYDNSNSSLYPTGAHIVDTSASSSILPSAQGTRGGESTTRYESRANMGNNHNYPPWDQTVQTLNSSLESHSSTPPPNDAENKLSEALLSLTRTACNTPSTPLLTRSTVKTAVGAAVATESRREQSRPHSPVRAYLPSVLPLPLPQPQEPPMESIHERMSAQSSPSTWLPSISSSSSTSSLYSHSQSQLHMMSNPRSSSSTQSNNHGDQHYQSSSSYLNNTQKDLKARQIQDANTTVRNVNSSRPAYNHESSSQFHLPLDTSMNEINANTSINCAPIIPTVKRKSTSQTGAIWNQDFSDDYVPLTAVGKLIQQLSLDQDRGGNGFAAMLPPGGNQSCRQGRP